MINRYINQYGFFGIIRYVIFFIYTKVFFTNARLIRLPFDLRGKKFIKFGDELTIGHGCRIQAQPIDGKSTCLQIGNNVEINDYVHIGAVFSVIIEDNVLLASKIFITDHNHGSYSSELSDKPTTPPAIRKLSYKPVHIHKNVWIGESVCILPGVSVGEGSIIGASSVVNIDIPANCIAVGNPVKIVKIFNFQKSKWEKF
jgi:acetyltransferase-like isoleucine patch superfamily enzyme